MSIHTPAHKHVGDAGKPGQIVNRQVPSTPEQVEGLVSLFSYDEVLTFTFADEAEADRFAARFEPGADSAAAPETQSLICDVCGAECSNPWHYSAGDRRHLHACDACWPGINPAPAIPDGWRLVPMEPTPEMLGAFQQGFRADLLGAYMAGGEL